MPMARTDQRVGNFMKDGVADMIIPGMPHIMPRQGNLAPPIIALAGAPARIVKPHCPAVKPMFAHQDGGGIKRGLERAGRFGHLARLTVTRLTVSAPHAPPAISPPTPPPESRQARPR